MDTIINLVTTGFSYIGPFVLLLGMLIFIHELGHFSVAKFFKVRVETFSLGFGKKILSYKKGDTTYALSLIPLGGYVKMFGDDPNATVSERDKPHSFLHKPVWQRILIVLAGPFMNFFFAIFLFAVIISVGHEVIGPKIGDITPNSIAYTAGFRSGDTITQVGAKAVATWEQVKEAIQSSPAQDVNFSVVREGTGTTETVKAPVIEGPNNDVFAVRERVGTVEGLDVFSTAAVIGWSNPDSLAAKAEFRQLDLIESINGQKVEYFRQLEPMIRSLGASGTLEFVVKSVGGGDVEKLPARTLKIEGFKLPPEGQDVLSAIGFEKSELFLMSVKEKSPAEKAGLQVGDRILAIDGKKISKWDDILGTVKSYTADKEPLSVEIRRQGKPMVFEVKPELTELMNKNLQDEHRFTIGIIPAFTSVPGKPVLERMTNPLNALVYGFQQSVHWSKLVVVSILKLVQNEVSSRNIAGVITIGRVANQSFSVGFDAFFKIMAVISINLFLLNLLPIPILDGGHLVFFTIEAIRGAPISMRKMEIAQQFGLIVMMSLMFFSLFNDIRNIFHPPW